MKKGFSRKGRRIKKWDDRLIFWSVIFCILLSTAAGVLLVNCQNVTVRVSEYPFISKCATVILFDAMLLLVIFALVKKQGTFYEYLEDRQLLARMIMDNAWYETDMRSNNKGEQDVTYVPRLYYWRRHSITYFPRMYYRKRKGTILVTVKISMGRYQDKLLCLEEKLETGLDCELVWKEIRGRWIQYELLTGVEKNRIPAGEVRAGNGSVLLMKHISWKYNKLPHMLVAGDTGSGKTLFLLTLVEGLLRAGAELVIVDPKKADLSYLEHILPEVYSEPEDIMECLGRFYKDMEERYDAMGVHPGYRMGMNYADLGMEAHFLVFDEYVAFAETLGKKEWENAVSLLKKVVMKGRQAGYFIILACQRSDAKYLGDGIRDQFGFRVALGMMSDSGYTMMFGNVDKTCIPKKIPGRGYVNTGDGVITEFYAPFVPEGHDFIAEIRGICQESKAAAMPRSPESTGWTDREAGTG